MKFSSGPFEITKKYLDQMQERRELFRAATKTRKALHLTMVTTYGLKPNAWSGMIQNEIVLDDLFAAEQSARPILRCIMTTRLYSSTNTNKPGDRGGGLRAF